MFPRRIFLAGLLAVTFAGCSDLSENPLHTLARSGHDARYFNPQTGRYEWPEDTAPRRTPRTAAIDDAVSESETPAETTPAKPFTPGAGDDRVYDPMKQRFESPR